MCAIIFYILHFQFSSLFRLQTIRYEALINIVFSNSTTLYPIANIFTPLLQQIRFTLANTSITLNMNRKDNAGVFGQGFLRVDEEEVTMPADGYLEIETYDTHLLTIQCLNHRCQLESEQDGVFVEIDQHKLSIYSPFDNTDTQCGLCSRNEKLPVAVPMSMSISLAIENIVPTGHRCTVRSPYEAASPETRTYLSTRNVSTPCNNQLAYRVCFYSVSCIRNLIHCIMNQV